MEKRIVVLIITSACFEFDGKNQLEPLISKRSSLRPTDSLSHESKNNEVLSRTNDTGYDIPPRLQQKNESGRRILIRIHTGIAD
jgi:N-acetylmuramoyl-L-alanine amidase